MSEETISSSEYSIIPFMFVVDAFFMVSFIFSALDGLFVVIVAKMWQHEVHTIMSGMQPDSTVSTRR